MDDNNTHNKINPDQISDFNLILESDSYEEIDKKLTQAISIALMLICNGDAEKFNCRHDIIVSAIENVHDLMVDAKAKLYEAA